MKNKEKLSPLDEYSGFENRRQASVEGLRGQEGMVDTDIKPYRRLEERRNRNKNRDAINKMRERAGLLNTQS